MIRIDTPNEHIIVFDEAQRAWDADYGARKFKHTASEASIILDIMERHKDFAVIVALIGNGQEINTGEAGLAEWGKSLAARPNWIVRAASQVLTAAEPKQKLFKSNLEHLEINEALHLNVPIRNIQSPSAANWIDAVLRADQKQAQRFKDSDLPIYITRSLAEMRASLHARARGNRRSGLVCSSGAKRLVAEGLWPRFPHQDEKAVANWFLKRWPDVRASDALEIPATEFACQGLELDFVGLCWGGDLLWDNRWIARNFKGTKWQSVRAPESIAYTINTYRVLLTRARIDTIIWIPQGGVNDETRKSEEFDKIANFLVECGAQPLKSTHQILPIKKENSLF